MRSFQVDIFDEISDLSVIQVIATLAKAVGRLTETYRKASNKAYKGKIYGKKSGNMFYEAMMTNNLTG